MLALQLLFKAAQSWSEEQETTTDQLSLCGVAVTLDQGHY